MKVEYRPAQPSDAKDIAHYLHMASGGISNFLLHDILPNCSIEDLITLGVVEESSMISYANTVVAVISDKIVGIVNYYPADQHQIPDIMRAFIPQERIDYISPLFNTYVADSLYLHALAVEPGCASLNTISFNLIFRQAAVSAKKIGLSKLSAHVWCDNLRVLHALLKKGFTVQEYVDIKYHPLMPHKDGMVLLCYNLEAGS